MQGSVLDGEAKARGTTVYLVDRRLDMLPALLSEDACSLLAGVDRLAVSVLWQLDGSFRTTGVWFGRSVIRCCWGKFLGYRPFDRESDQTVWFSHCLMMLTFLTLTQAF